MIGAFTPSFYLSFEVINTIIFFGKVSSSNKIVLYMVEFHY